jgi:TonB family protein
MTPPVPARYLASLVAAVLLTGSPAKAFVINTNASPETDALEAAKTAAVWSANMRSLLESGERGLGGGLEYSVDPSVCTELNFVDDSSCEDIRALIAAAGAMWSLGNPNISFVDVTDHIAATRGGTVPVSARAGAEINFFAVPRAELIENLQGSTATTQTFYIAAKPVSTNGLTLWESEGILGTANVDFVTDVCYYLREPVAPGICVSFAQVLLHELGHVLGLAHPELEAFWNLDSDNDPTTPVTPGCQPFLASLRVSPNFDPDALMLATRGPADWESAIKPDDYAGRDFLYPICTPEERAAAIAAAPPPPPPDASETRVALSYSVAPMSYPIDSLLQNESGRNVLQLTFAADGSVKDATMTTPSGVSRLDDMALEIARSGGIAVDGAANATLLTEFLWTLPLRPADDILAPDDADLAPLDSAPDLLRMPQDRNLLTVPNASAAAGEQGVVALSVTIASDNSVSAVEVSETSGYARLDAAAVSLARAAGYEAGQQSGAAQVSVLQMAVAYNTLPSASSSRCYSWPLNVVLPTLRITNFNAVTSEQGDPMAQRWIKVAADGRVETMLLSTSEGWMHVDDRLRDWWTDSADIPVDHPQRECWYYRPFVVLGR